MRIGLLDQFHHIQHAPHHRQGDLDLNSSQCVRLFLLIDSIQGMVLMITEGTYGRPMTVRLTGSTSDYFCCHGYFSLSSGECVCIFLSIACLRSALHLRHEIHYLSLIQYPTRKLRTEISNKYISNC